MAMNQLFRWLRTFFQPSVQEESKIDPRVKVLQKQLTDTVRKMEEWQKKMEELEIKHYANLRNISELQSALEQHKKHVEDVEPERERWARERKQLEESVAELEAILEFEKNKWDEERESAMKEMNVACKKNYSRIKANLSDFDEQWKTAEKATEQKMEAEKRLQKTAQQMVDLTSEIRQQKLEAEKVKQENDDDNDAQLQIINELQERLNYSMEEKNTAERQRDRASRERKQLEKRLAQLEAVLAFKNIRILSKKFQKFPEFCSETKKERRKWRAKARYKLKQTILLLSSLTPVIERNESLNYVDFSEALQYLSINKLKAAIKMFEEKEAGQWGIQYANTVKTILELMEKEVAKL